MGFLKALKKQPTAARLFFYFFFWGVHIALLAYGWWV
jgi:hypothetical protein